MNQIIDTMSLHDESYLCLLCLRDSTERMAQLYLAYIKLRQNYTHEVPPVLLTVLIILHDKRESLEDKLQATFPAYMAETKWHDPDEQGNQLSNMTEESRKDLQQVCSTEMKLLMLITEMMKQ